jgi:glycosyltransferase involved in cell wall biosynthesis
MKKHKILLVGEFSNVHWTLAEGLRSLGHQVDVASKGDGWKGYKRDIDLSFKNKLDVMRFFLELFFTKKFSGYDVVQLINFRFLYPEERDLYNKIIFNVLRKRNKSVFLAAYGDDYYWSSACRSGAFPYSPYDALDKGYAPNVYYDQMMQLNNFASRELNEMMAQKSNGIIAGLYDYYYSYAISSFKNKLEFIPFPINTKEISYKKNTLNQGEKMRIFMGIQTQRSVWKGTDVLLQVLTEYVAKYSDEMELIIAESVPFDTYIKMYEDAHVFVDQLYSQGFAMNALYAMAKGKVVLSGGENKMYALYGDSEIEKPVINIVPEKEKIIGVLDQIRQNKNRLEEMGLASRKFVEQYHDYKVVARQYVQVWESAI